MLKILDEAGGDLPPAVLHCFTGDRAAAEAYLERGLHLGVTGWVCDERRGEALRGAVPAIPAGRLMLETDAPFLYPRSLPWPLEGEGAKKPSRNRNEPAFLPHVAEAVAALRGEPVEALAAHTTAAAVAFFGSRDDFPHWEIDASA
jgi:TatD DNase family protein